MRILYSFSIPVFVLCVRIASLFNPKAKKWLEGRKKLFVDIEKKISELRTPNSPLKDPEYRGPIGQTELIWFHCSSLGEFEQGRPLIEKIRNQKPDIKILLTFFSPSGFEVRKNYEGADWVCYLPADTIYNAKKFLDIVKPSAVIFVKYEFWFNFLNEICKRKIPLFLVSANFRREQHFFRWYGRWAKKHLYFFTHIFVQAANSELLLKSKGINNVSVSGDTRFDRVYEISKTVKEIPVAKIFSGNSLVIVAGSTWKDDEKILANLKFETLNFKLILAPHEIDETHLQQTEQLFSHFKTVRFSKATEQNISDKNVLIIDNIGMLSSLFQYGKIAYIGGGFGSGIHNILEPAAFGMPVIFGPNHHKFREAQELIGKGGAFSINSSESFRKILNFLLNDKMILQIAAQVSKNYVFEQKGATEKIMGRILPQKK